MATEDDVEVAEVVEVAEDAAEPLMVRPLPLPRSPPLSAFRHAARWLALAELSVIHADARYAAGALTSAAAAAAPRARCTRARSARSSPARSRRRSSPSLPAGAATSSGWAPATRTSTRRRTSGRRLRPPSRTARRTTRRTTACRSCAPRSPTTSTRRSASSTRPTRSAPRAASKRR